MSELDIGAKIQSCRKQKGITLTTLSEMTQLSASMLSQLERGLANPSINTLKIIADALDVALYEFFVETPQQSSYFVTPEERRKLILPEGEDVIYEFLVPDLNGSIEYCIMTLQPGAVSSAKRMSHKGEEVGYILEGSMTMSLETMEKPLNTGDSFKLPPFTNHRWINHTDQVAKLLFAITPPSF